MKDLILSAITLVTLFLAGYLVFTVITWDQNPWCPMDEETLGR